MRILERHLIREFLLVQGAVVALLLLIIIGGVVGNTLRDVSEGRLPLDVLPYMVLIASVRALLLLWPVALFLAFLLVLGRSQRDSELIAMQANGFSFVHLYRAIFAVAVPASIVLALLMASIPPLIDRTIEHFRILAETRSDLVGVTPGRFMMSRIGNQVFYGERFSPDGKTLLNVFLYREQDGRIEVTLAEQARMDLDPEGRFLILEQGHRYVGTPGTHAFEMLEFTRLRVEIPDPIVVSGRIRHSSMGLAELWEERADPRHRAELEWRIAIPVSMLLLALLALPLGLTPPRSGRYSRIPWAILVYVVYANFLLMGKNWIANEQSPLWLGLWWTHLVPLLLWAVLAMKVGMIRIPRKPPPTATGGNPAVNNGRQP